MRPLFLHGHNRPLTKVLFNRDGDIMFSAGKDSFLVGWYANTGICLGNYNCGKGVVWDIDCSLDSNVLVAASAEQKIMIFDVCTGEILYDIKEAGPCKSIELCKMPGNQNKFALAHDSFGQQSTKCIKVYQFEGGNSQILWTQSDYSSRCTKVSWGPFDETIITCHEDGSIYVWDAANGKYIKDFMAHKQQVTSASFSNDKHLMLTCSSDGIAKLWDTIEFRCLKTYQTDRPLNACDISPLFDKGPERKCHIILGGGQAAEDVTTTGAGEGKFQALIYNMVHCEEVGSVKGHFGPINTIAWMPNGAGYASGGEDGYVRIYHFDDDYFTDKYD